MSTPPQAHAEESPRRAATGSPLTPEQLARIERNRREALVRQTNNARGRRQLTASTANETVSALVHSPVSALPPSMAPLPETTLLEQRTTTAQPAIAPSKLQPAPTFARWYDYDLSTLKDSKGGFLYDEQPTGSSGTTSDHTNARKRGRYDVKSDDTRPPTTVIYPHEMVPGVSHESPLDAAESSLGPNGDVRAHQTAWTTQRCRDCTTSPDLDADMLRYFRVRVCRECRDRDASRYTLLTKTEAKEGMGCDRVCMQRMRCFPIASVHLHDPRLFAH